MKVIQIMILLMMSVFMAQSVQAETISLLCKVSWYNDGKASYSVDKIAKIDTEAKTINGRRMRAAWDEDRIAWDGYKRDGVFTKCAGNHGHFKFSNCSGFLNRHTGEIEDGKSNPNGEWIGYKGTCRKSKALF